MRKSSLMGTGEEVFSAGIHRCALSRQRCRLLFPVVSES